MKKILQVLIIFLFAFSIYAQEPVIKFYYQDNSVKSYNISDIDNINVLKSETLTSIFIHCKDESLSFLYQLNMADKISFDNNQITLVFTDSTFKRNLIDLDSIIFRELLGHRPNEDDHALPYVNADWLGFIPDYLKLTQITIPGTHDTGADRHSSEQGCEEDQTIAQDYRLSNQLLMGVRCFDIRLSYSMGVFHWKYYLHKQFSNLLDDALAFLKAHPTEFVIFIIKQEHTSEGDHDFGNAVWNELLDKGIENFYLRDDIIPTIGDLRGQIMIVRQFAVSDDFQYQFGYHWSWSKNTGGELNGYKNILYAVQDHYSIVTVSYDEKNFDIENMIQAAADNYYSEKGNCYYLNFTSAEKQVRDLRDVYCNIAPVINDYLKNKKSTHCGIIMLNFAGGSDNGKISPDLLQTVINKNKFVYLDTLTIGTQVWSRSNSSQFTYANGDPINTCMYPVEWGLATEGAFYYGLDYLNKIASYGLLYNWNAVNDPRGLAPKGWHIPTNAEWQTLIDYLGGVDVAGGKLKQKGTTYWLDPNAGATDHVHFKAVPAGEIVNDGLGWVDDGYKAYWWTADAVNHSNALGRYINYNQESIHTTSSDKKFGYSVRFIKNAPDYVEHLTIGSQVWSKYNLSTLTYANGDSIKLCSSKAEWASCTEGACIIYSNDEKNKETYGILYNWYAVHDSRGLAPNGWHIPTDAEWQTLINHLGGQNVAGGKLKQKGTTHWKAPNTGATDEVYFSALPGGQRTSEGIFQDIGHYANYWTSTDSTPGNAYARFITNDQTSIPLTIHNKHSGLSVRLVKN
jgi:uncharacterized protein (TIGR02145 family)